MLTFSVPFASSLLSHLPYHHMCSSALPPPSSHPPTSPSIPSRPPTTIRGLSDLFPASNASYDALLLDQFGVLHDGQTAYPGAVKAVENLVRLGVKIVILSNTSRRACEALNKLRRYGFQTEWFAGAVTSGELAYNVLRKSGIYGGKNVVHCNWVKRGGVRVLNEFGLQCVGRNVDDMEMMLAHGTEGVTVQDGDGSEVEAMEWDVLVHLVRAAARKRGVHFVCANPDLVTVDGGKLRLMPGSLAAEYEKAGGEKVVRLGKPEKVVYEAAMTVLGVSGIIDRARVLAVGDSLLHDMLGATEAGIDTLFIAGGIAAHHFNLGGDLDNVPGKQAITWSYDVNTLERLIDKEAPRLSGRLPTTVAPYFRW